MSLPIVALSLGILAFLFNPAHAQTGGGSAIPVSPLSVGQGHTIGNANSIWSNAGANINRVGDRLFVGAAAAVNGGNVPESPSDWTNSSPSLLSFSQNAQTVSISTLGLIGGFFATRTSDFGANAAGALAGAFYTLNDDTSHTATNVEALYVECHRNTGTSTGCVGQETDVGNSGTVVTMDPFAAFPATSTIGHIIACGGAVSSSANCSAAIAIQANPNTFRVGIEAMSASLDSSVGAGGNGTFARLASGQGIQWVDTGAVTTAELWGVAGGGLRTNSPVTIGAAPNTAVQLNVKGQGATSGTYQIASANGSAANALLVRDDGYVGLTSGTGQVQYLGTTYQSCAGFTSNASGFLVCTPSTEAMKNIAGAPPETSFAGVTSLAPIKFRWKDEDKEDTHAIRPGEFYGLSAEKVCALDETLCIRGKDGVIKTYDDRGLMALVIGKLAQIEAKIGK